MEAGGGGMEAGGALPTVAEVKMLCTEANTPYHKANGMAFTPQQFCVLFGSVCAGKPANVKEQDLTVESTCETAYAGWTMAQTVCRTDHLCNANVSAAMATTHCPHTQTYAGNTTCP